MSSRHRWWATVLASALLASPVAAQEPAPSSEQAGTQEPDPTGPKPSDQAEPSAPEPAVPETYVYLIAPGDVLRITVWKEPRLDTDVSVRLDGKISVPLLGDVPAEGRTPDELTLVIRDGLRQFLEVPQVTVSVAQALSARFYVLGEVVLSATFPLSGRTTVLQALAIAGGFKEFAKKDRIMIIREHRGQKEAIPFNFSDIEAGINLETNVVLEPGDTVLVP